ncbi:hypothetical protein E2C01_078310 [Portunus trituberculatus]|uniref:Uncharacterized protein n=1 Tax=Portunus trituberculatus TaxID=210409 RepID=A0A5B7ISE4_PORTR|nr:hypothetical protein [Portunus trituberculatus]
MSSECIGLCFDRVICWASVGSFVSAVMIEESGDEPCVRFAEVGSDWRLTSRCSVPCGNDAKNNGRKQGEPPPPAQNRFPFARTTVETDECVCWERAAATNRRESLFIEAGAVKATPLFFTTSLLAARHHSTILTPRSLLVIGAAITPGSVTTTTSVGQQQTPETRETDKTDG